MSNDTTDARKEMIDLLKTKRPAAQSPFFHGAIAAGESILNELFAAEDYDVILDFLQSGTSVRDPGSGQPLVVPGKPDESAFFLQISRTDGVMFGRFSDDEVATVRSWIEQLPTGPGAAEVVVTLRSERIVTGLTKTVQPSQQT